MWPHAAPTSAAVMLPKTRACACTTACCKTKHAVHPHVLRAQHDTPAMAWTWHTWTLVEQVTLPVHMYAQGG